MVLWCQSAARLSAALPAHWRVEQLVMSRMEDIDSYLRSSAGCGSLWRIPVQPELRRLAARCVNTRIP